ncbi:MAG: hypothetical protein GY759_21970 [Chloroflexi bacterium]|nr:hypothetical protein [Chloroflexota bacterium]
MNRQNLFRAIVVTGLIFLLAATLILAQEGETPTSEPLAAAAAVGTAFTYQGQLENGDGPVNASCDFEFALYDAATDGRGASPLAKTATVSDGLFSVTLDFGAGAFNGEARWLEIAACCPSTCTPTTLDPRQELTPAPYALYAPPSDVKQLIQDFVVASGESVTAGDVVGFLDGYVHQGSSPGSEHVFNADSAGEMSAAALSSTQLVVAYRDKGNSDFGTAVIGDVSGATITYGPEVVFNSDGTSYISVAALSSTKFVVSYSDDVNSKHGTAVIGDVSGSTISFGNEYVFNPDDTTATAPTNPISATSLSSTKFVVAYRDGGNSDSGTAVIGDVSGSTISFGTEAVFNSGDTAYISVAALSSSKFVVAYTDEENSKYGTAVIGDVSGSTISYGSQHVFNSTETKHISAAALSSTHFVVAYADGDGDGPSSDMFGTAVIGDVSGSTIDYGNEYVFNVTRTELISTAALSSTQFVVAYSDVNNSGFGTAVIGDVSGSTIDYGNEYVFNPAVTTDNSAAALSSTQFVVAYTDNGNSEYGTALVIGPIGSTVGIAGETKTDGETVPVIIGGVSDVHSGLTQGEIYYIDISGDLTTSETDRRIGLAISDTELLLDIEIH